MQSVLRRLALISTAWLALLLVLELLCRMLPVSTATHTGYHVDPALLTYPPGHRWTASTGWDLRNAHRLQANNMGFAAGRDFVPNPDAVALIGDSFVEASMLDATDRPAAQLERALGARRPVYAMGGPGSSLLDYAERIRWTARQFGTRDVVVLMERGDVRQSLCGSGNVHSACLDRTTLAPRTEAIPGAGTAKALLRRSALAQYLFSQLKLDPATLWRNAVLQSRPAHPEPAKAASSPAPSSARFDARIVDAVTDRFFERIADSRPDRLVIVLDSDRSRLAAHQPIDDPERHRFIERARSRGAIVVDTEPLFAAHHAASTLRLDVGPYDTHLNKLGIRLAMQAAAQPVSAR